MNSNETTWEILTTVGSKFLLVNYRKTRTGTLLEDKLLYKNQIKNKIKL
jgi:hypothetical protein